MSATPLNCEIQKKCTKRVDLQLGKNVPLPFVGYSLHSVNFSIFSINSLEAPPQKNLIFGPIQLFFSTEIFSKRRKICAWWRKTTANSKLLFWGLHLKCPSEPRGIKFWIWRRQTLAHCLTVVKLPLSTWGLLLESPEKPLVKLQSACFEKLIF